MSKPADARNKRRLLNEFKVSKGNKKIGDLEEIAQAFSCRWRVTKNGHQHFIPPDRTLNIVNVAIPHSNGDVLRVYLTRFIRMLEDILDLEEENGGDLHG